MSDDFFPFPNEKFFLLYCYAHSVMRPKVKGKIYINYRLISRSCISCEIISYGQNESLQFI